MTPESAASHHPSRTTWLMVALVPVMLVIGLLAAYLIEGAVAPDTVGDQRSLASDLLGGLVIVVLVLLPAAAAWRSGARAEALGASAAPRLVGAGLAAIAVGIVVVQLLANAAGGSY